MSPVWTLDARCALIVFGHGSRDPVWAETLVALSDRVRRAMPGLGVELAYLEFMTPTLGECVQGLWQRGCREIAVLPAFVAEGAHLRQQLPELVERAGSDRAGLTIRLLPAMGDLPDVQEGVVRYLKVKLARSN